MTTRVVYSRHAAAEVEEITAFLAEHSQAAANRFARALERADQRLSRFPNSGAPGLLPGTRLILLNYVVSYRRRGNDVEIFAVRHARRSDAPAPTTS
jgi:toxin ParE1/3/4